MAKKNVEKLEGESLTFSEKYDLCEGVASVVGHSVIGTIDFNKQNIDDVDLWYADGRLDGVIIPKVVNSENAGVAAAE